MAKTAAVARTAVIHLVDKLQLPHAKPVRVDLDRARPARQWSDEWSGLLLPLAEGQHLTSEVVWALRVLTRTLAKKGSRRGSV
jgi:hypothetical protein